MILSAKIIQSNAQTLISYLKAHEFFDGRFKSKKDGDYLCFAVTKRFDLDGVTFEEVSEKYFEPALTRMTLREALADVLSDDELQLLKSAFDQVGSIAILEIDEELRSKETLIGEKLLELNGSIKTVLRKDGKHQGTYRTQPMKCIAGIDTRIANFVENGARMKVDVEMVYFSARLSNERMRIANQVKANEEVLVMFSGAAPQPVILGKHSSAKHVLGIEINPEGHKYGLENIKLNKLKNVELICGDVHEETPKLDKTFDRIVMNLPKTAYEFLDDAMKLLKPNGVLHYYDFLHEDEFDVANERVRKVAEKVGRNVLFNGIFTVGSQGVKTYRICVDCVVN